MKQNTIEKEATIFGLLSDPTRLRILHLLSSAKEDFCVNEISDSVGASQSATSHQLKKLELIGVVSKCRYGQEICYCLDKKSDVTKRILKCIKLVN